LQLEEREKNTKFPTDLEKHQACLPACLPAYLRAIDSRL